jgi:hypothetical protein
VAGFAGVVVAGCGVGVGAGVVVVVCCMGVALGGVDLGVTVAGTTGAVFTRGEAYIATMMVSGPEFW